MPASVFVHEPRHFHIEAAILGDLENASFPPPTDRVQSHRGFLNAESGLRDRVQSEAMPNPLFHVGHQIGSRQFRHEIEDRVAHQHLVIEIEDVESDYEIGPAQPLDQQVHLRFAENFVAPRGCAIDHADRHPHVAFARPAAGIVRRALSFEVEVNDVSQHPRISTSPGLYFNSKPPQSKLII